MSPKDMKRMKDSSVCKNNQSICFPLQEILINKYINRPFSTDNTVLIKELFLSRSNTRIQSLPEIRIIQDNDRSIGEDFFNSVFYLAGWCSKLLSYHFNVLLQIGWGCPQLLRFPIKIVCIFLFNKTKFFVWEICHLILFSFFNLFTLYLSLFYVKLSLKLAHFANVMVSVLIKTG